MEKSYIEYKGERYPTIEISLNKISDIESEERVVLADIELFFAIEEDYENDVYEAVDIDNSVYYYCDSGFVESCPSESEVIEYMSDK